MQLSFFLVRIKVEAGKRKSELYLRCKPTEESEDLANNEPVLTSFCFPLGPDAVPAKEYMASEVIGCFVASEYSGVCAG